MCMTCPSPVLIFIPNSPPTGSSPRTRLQKVFLRNPVGSHPCSVCAGEGCDTQGPIECNPPPSIEAYAPESVDSTVKPKSRCNTSEPCSPFPESLFPTARAVLSPAQPLYPLQLPTTYVSTSSTNPRQRVTNTPHIIPDITADGPRPSRQLLKAQLRAVDLVNPNVSRFK
jgi:hypothetical protein